ncbi:YadA-like family protein [Veillonella atypica]|uniref:YadA-like family protein n=1 Tax=Veillonella atypica TaxID=39777 RepID=UPI001D07BEB3|nr:YadA-like family protein [Veillonella atypica]MCB6770892.1 YadA-like family protein [Veillonella atypica]
MEDGKNTKASSREVNGVKTFKVDVEGDLTGITSITNAGPTKMEIGPNSINITGGTLNMGGNKITNVGPATSGTDAVNYDQLKNSRTVVTSKDGSVTVTPTTNGDKTTYDLHVTAGAAASSWNIASDKVSATEGTVAAGSAASQNIKDTKTVTMQAGKNLTVNQTNDGNGNASVAFALDKDLKDLTSVTTDKVTTKEIGLQDAGGNTTTIKKDGDRITYSNDGGTTVNKVANLGDEKHITKGEYSVGADGKVTMTYTNGNGDLVTGETAVIKNIADQNLSNITNAAKNVITGLGTIVKAGDNVTVSEASDATTGQKTYTVNAVTPAVYTKADGTKVVKRPNGTYTTNIDGSAGNDVPASDVIVSFQDAAGNTTGGNSIVNNVGSAIDKTGTSTGNTFLTKLDTAATNTPNAAVNVKDLKNTSDAIIDKGLKFDANVGGAKTNKLGSTVKVQGAGTGADANYSGANIKTFIDQDTAGNTTIDVKLDKNLTGINSITGDTNSGKLVFQDPTATGNNGDAFKFTGGNINVGGNNITNLKSGIVNNNATDDTNAANIGDVKTIAKDTDLHIAPTESNRTGEHIAGGATGNTAAGAATNAYKYDATTKQVVLEYNDGNGTNKTGTKAVIDLSNLPTGGDMSSFKVTSSAESTTVGTHAGDASQEIKNGKSVDFQAGKNMTVKQTNDANGNTTINYALDKDLDVESVHVGKDGKDGKIGIDGAAGTNGINGTTRVDIKVEKGVDGIDGANGTDGISRIVYEDKTGTHTVATMDDGLKFTGNNETTTNNHKLGTLVKVKGEGVTEAQANAFTSAAGNIAVVADGTDTLTVKLNKNLAGINKISNGNSSITLNDTPSATTPAVTITGGNLSMGDGTTNNKIVNLAPGTDDTDAVNYKQLKAAKTEVKAGKNVVVTSETSTTDGHTTYTVNASTPAVYTKPDGTKLVKQPDGTFKEENGTAYNGPVIASFEDGTGATTGGNMIINNVGSAIKGLGSTGDNYLTKLDLANTATPNAAVNVSDLKNTADALKSNELHIRPTTSGRTGETVNQGAGGTAESYKYDATTKSVTLKYNDGTGAGVTGTEAKIDLSDLANQITSGYTFKANATANGGTVANDATTPAVATTVENGGTINYAAGKNLTVKQDIDATAKTHTYTYSLNKDLTNLDKVVVNGENGTNGKDGVTIIGPQGATGATGMPGTNGIDGKVGIAGKDGKDAVSISGKDGIGTIGLTGPQGPAGADGRGVDITTDHGTQTLNKPEANNGGKSERIVYVPKDKDGNPLKDDAGNTIKREVATMDDGLKFTGNNESTENKHKLGSLVKVKGEGVTEAQANAFTSAAGNIAVVADGTDTLTVKLNKNLAGINKISNGGSSITLNDTPSTTTPAVTITGGNLSMGDGTTNNKIVNLAPGTDDTDAVNYKQLKAAKTEVKAGKNVVVTSETSTTDGHTTYTVNASTPAVYTKPDGTKLVKQPDGTFKEENGTAYNGPVIASFEDGTGATTGGNMIVNNIGSAIKNQTGGDFLTKLDNANTATPNAAVNVSDLKSTADALKANERHIAPTTVAAGSTETKGGTANAAGTANVYKYDAASKTVTLTYNDGNGNAVTDTKAVIDLSNLSTGGTGASSWNIASDKVSATEGAVAAGSAGTQNIADGKTVTMKAGKNLTVNQVNDGAGNASVAFSLDKNLENLDKVVVNGNDGATGQAGVSIVGPKGANGVDGNDGKVGIAGKDGKDAVSISGKDGVGHIGLQGPKGTPGTPGADGANLDITTDHGTQTLVKPEANNNNKSERIVYVPKDANGNPLKDTDGNDIKREVATMDDGLKFTGNNTGTVNKHKLGSLVKVQGEGVSATDEAAFVSASGNIAVTAENNDTLTIRLNKNLKGLNSIQLGGNTIQSNGDNITFTTNGGTTKTVATTDQLWTIQANGTDVPAKSGKVNLVAGDHITITPDAANGKMTISATGFGSMDGFNVKTSAESATVGTHAGDTTENIKNGKTVDMQAGKNLIVTQTNDGNGNTTVNYALNKDVDLGTNGSLKAGDTTVNKDGVTIANGPSITKTGVDAGDKKITNVADGAVNATSKDAVNGSQLKKYTDAAKTTVEAGDTNVKVETDNSAADGHTNYKVSLEPVVTIGDTHKVKIDGHTGDITGLTNVTLTDPTFATKGRAATEEQLDKVLTEAKKKAVEKVQAGTAAAGDTNIATVAPKAGDTFGAAGATYEVSVSKNAVKDAAKEAVKVTSASPAITVTADTSVAHETTYKVGFDGNQAATQIPLTYKQNGGSARTVKLSDGLNFIDGTNTKARTAADGKVTFDVMGDLTGITSISNAAGGPKMTFGGNSINVTNGDLNMGGNKITNLGKGTATTDAATVGQLTKVTSNNHSVVINKTTDANGAPVYDLAVTGTPGAPAADPRVDMLGEEIGRVGAQGAALSALKPIQYDPLEPTQIMAGYGNYRGNSAVALGVAHYKNESTLIHGGVSWAGGSSHMMANAGVTWKVGNRDSEAAVADRYRKGPISSAYAMQQEMAAMKAQNAGLKGEVSDLKAENEQMKAQIAAMMAKLGL